MNRPQAGSRRAARLQRGQETVFDFTLAMDALPLIRRIVADIAQGKANLTQRQTERRLLDKSADGCKRFQLDDQIRELRTQLRAVIDELHKVGVTLLDPLRGDVGFPTIVNGSLAYLVYRTNEEGIRSWRYRDQTKLRPVPSHWCVTPIHRHCEEEEGLLV